MLKRPSSRSKTAGNALELNLVPMLDALVTLITFLLYTTSFMAIASIDSPVPLVAPAEKQLEQLKEKPLQLTAYIQEGQLTISDWSGSRVNQTIKNFPDPKTGESRYDLEAFHNALIAIKLKYPHELKLIVKPESGVAYESIVSVIDSSRKIEKSDPPMFKKNADGVDEPETKLFPEVIFGNIMS